MLSTTEHCTVRDLSGMCVSWSICMCCSDAQSAPIGESSYLVWFPHVRCCSAARVYIYMHIFAKTQKLILGVCRETWQQYDSQSKSKYAHTGYITTAPVHWLIYVVRTKQSSDSSLNLLTVVYISKSSNRTRFHIIGRASTIRTNPGPHLSLV